MKKSEKNQPSVKSEESPEEKEYKKTLKTISFGLLLNMLFNYKSNPAMSKEALECSRGIFDEIDRREKKLNILWEREQETDSLSSEPYGHGDNCICKECWEKVTI